MQKASSKELAESCVPWTYSWKEADPGKNEASGMTTTDFTPMVIHCMISIKKVSDCSRIFFLLRFDVASTV